MNEFLTMAELQQEAIDHEFGARFDDVAERYAAEFGTCPGCGARTIDPFGCCDLS